MIKIWYGADNNDETIKRFLNYKRFIDMMIES